MMTEIPLPSSKDVATHIVNLSLSTGVGALVGSYYPIGTIGGAVFGVVHGISYSIVKTGMDKLFGDSYNEGIVKIAAKIFASFFTALFVTSFIGYSITLVSGAKISCAIILTNLAIKILDDALNKIPIVKKTVLSAATKL